MTKWRVLSAVVAYALLTGLVLHTSSVRAAEILVPGDYSSIRKAVDAASPGDTIKVHPGLYKEQITIDKDLQLKAVADDIGDTVIQVPSTFRSFAKNLASGLQVAAVIRITGGANVEISGFTVTGPIDCGIQGVGVAVVKDATLKITDSHVTRFRPESANCLPPQASGRAIFVGLPEFIRIKGESEGGSVGNATISRLIIDKYYSAGVTVGARSADSPSNVIVSNCEIIGGSDIPVNGQFGIVINWGIAKITGNIIRRNVCTGTGCGPDPFSDFQSGGIGAPFLGSKLTEISDNVISDTDVGVYGGGVGAEAYTIKNNRISSRLFGIAIQDGKARTIENTINGGKIGIGVFAGAANAVAILKGDRIRHTTDEKIKEATCCGFTAKAILRGN
jgi:hypothetical protein